MKIAKSAGPQISHAVQLYRSKRPKIDVNPGDRSFCKRSKTEQFTLCFKVKLKIAKSGPQSAF